MKQILRYLIVLACLLTIFPAHAQLDVSLSTPRRQYLTGEAVTLKLTFSNRTDRTITFENGPDFRWLTIQVKQRGSSTPLRPLANAKFPSLTIGPGSRRSFEINLKPFYDFSREGGYSASALVQVPNSSEYYNSNPTSFELSPGGSIQSFNIQARGQNLCASVRLMTVGKEDILYGQVSNRDTKQVIGACAFGKYYPGMKLKACLDSALNLYVLFQTSPEYYIYGCMDTFGKRRNAAVYRRGAGLIDLVTTGNGIRPIGLVPYTPKAQPKERVRSAAERPN